jgi:hypothetical protein
VSGRASLAGIVRALGGDLYAAGRRANVPAPGHSPADRSVSLLLDGDRVIVHSLGATSWQAALADLQARGLVIADGRLPGAMPVPGAETPTRAAREARARAHRTPTGTRWA